MPGGVNSPVRAFKNVDGKPVFFKSAKGPTLIDEDDNQYIDFIGSWGPMILGHSNPVVLDAIKAQLELGTSYGAPTSLESELARIIKSQVPSMEKIRILNTGTEATTRVSIESTDSQGKNWFTIGVSPNIIDASFKALIDSLDFKLFKDKAPASK